MNAEDRAHARKLIEVLESVVGEASAVASGPARLFRAYEEALQAAEARESRCREALQEIADSGHGTAGGYEGDVARAALDEAWEMMEDE